MLSWIPNLRGPALIWCLLAICLGALALSEGGQGNGPLWAELRAIRQKRAAVAVKPEKSIQDERPPRPRHLDVATPAQVAQAIRAERASAPTTPPPSSYPAPEEAATRTAAR